MKKNIIKTVLIAVFCFAAGYTAYNAQNKNEQLSDVMLANVEALASDESWLEDWWDSPVYACVTVQQWEWKCMYYKDVPIPPGGWGYTSSPINPNELVCGMFLVDDTDCVTGSDVSHCWDC